MHPNTLSTGCPWDGSPRTAPARRPLRVAATSPNRLLRAGQRGRCRHCGNRIDLYPRADGQPIALHPAELVTAHVPASCHWHLSSGIAHPHSDGSAWCRIPHAVLCPQRPPICRISPSLESVRRQLAVRTRRLIDTGVFTTPTARAPPVQRLTAPTARSCGCCWATTSPTRPVEAIRCVAQTSHRHRCSRPVLAPDSPPGSWRLLPPAPSAANPPCPRRRWPSTTSANCPMREQRRWRMQRCPAHATAPGAADLALAGWQGVDSTPARTAHAHPLCRYPPTHGSGER